MFKRPKGLPKGLPKLPEKLEKRVWTSKIFIVHGHDDLSKLQLARMLEKMGFESIILHELPIEGRTIIEKLEKESEDIGFVFVILTPDDVGMERVEMEKLGMNTERLSAEFSLNYRARQNVIFELGFFYGKLKRNKVCCLYKEGVELPSDISGVSYIKFKESPEEKYELKAAGLEPK